MLSATDDIVYIKNLLSMISSDRYLDLENRLDIGTILAKFLPNDQANQIWSDEMKSRSLNYELDPTSPSINRLSIQNLAWYARKDSPKSYNQILHDLYLTEMMKITF